jgi:hypothetical protein
VQVAERGDTDLTARFSQAIEDLAASEDPAVVNVIHVSFAENLVWGDDQEQQALAKLRKSFGPVTLQRFDEFEEWAAKIAQADLGASESPERVSPEVWASVRESLERARPIREDRRDA